MKKCVILFTIAAIMAQNAFAFCTLDPEKGLNCDISASVTAVQTTLEEFFSSTQVPAAMLSSLIQNGTVELPDSKRGVGKRKRPEKRNEAPQEVNFITLELGAFNRLVYKFNDYSGVTAQNEAALNASTSMFVSLKRFLFKVDPFACLFLMMLFLIRARGALPSACIVLLRVFSTPNSRNYGIGFFICDRNVPTDNIC